MVTIIILLSLLTTSASISQWSWVNPKPHDKTINEIYFLNNSSGIALGEKGSCIVTSDGGIIWTIKPSAGSFDFIKMHCVDNDNIYALSQKMFFDRIERYFYKSSNGGINWSKVEIGLEGYISDISFYDNHNFWVGFRKGSGCVVFGDCILKTTDGGTSWTEIEDNLIASPRALLSISELNILAVCQNIRQSYNSYIIQTTDGGNTWEQKYDLGLSTVYVFKNISANLILGVGWGGKIVKSTDNGNSWLDVSINTDISFSKIAVSNEKDILILGSTNNKSEVYQSTNDGDTWSKVFELNKKLDAISFKPNGEIWLGGNSGMLFKSTNKGNEWILTNCFTYENLKKVFFINPRIGWIVGENGYVIKTTNGGESWIQQSLSTNETMNSCVFVNDQVGYIIGTQGKIFKTSNGGSNWLQKYTNELLVLKHIARIDGDILIVTGDNGTILRTSDGGETWNNSNSGIQGNNRAVDLAAPKPNSIFAAFDSVIYFSSDTGKSWSAERTIPKHPAMPSITKISFPSQQVGYAFIRTSLYANYCYYKTTDGGINWRIIGTSFPCRDASKLLFIDESTGWVIDDKLMFTSDGGHVWGFNEYIRGVDMQMFDKDKGWIVGNHGSILRTEIYDPITDIQEIPKKYVLYQNYPNPFNPTTKIIYDVSSSAFIKIRIINLLGEVVDDLINEYKDVGQYMVEWDGKNFPSGIYFYQMLANNIQITRKMILIR